jgi:hypothetical protein
MCLPALLFSASTAMPCKNIHLFFIHPSYTLTPTLRAGFGRSADSFLFFENGISDWMIAVMRSPILPLFHRSTLKGRVAFLYTSQRILLRSRAIFPNKKEELPGAAG